MAGNKLINTLRYGSSRTKRKIYLMFGVLAVGVALTIAALILGNELLGLAAFGVIFADGLVLFNTSFENKTVMAPPRKKRSKRDKKTKKDKEAGEESRGALDWISSEKEEKNKDKEKEKDREKEEDKETEDENPLLQYDEKALKKIMIAYKVKKHHILVMIDSSQSERISQCPAYMWKEGSWFYFLLLEKNPRVVKSPVAESREIHIRRGMSARPAEEYVNMQETSLVSMVFGGLLPNYYEVEKDAFRREHRKNLYSAAPGIWCTSASVKNLLKLLPAKFVLDDGKIDDENSYYQDIYISRLMFWDNIYSGKEYREKVLEILGQLGESGLSDGTVQLYLEQMMRKGLIPKEYAEYVFNKKRKK